MGLGDFFGDVWIVDILPSAPQILPSILKQSTLNLPVMTALYVANIVQVKTL